MTPEVHWCATRFSVATLHNYVRLGPPFDKSEVSFGRVMVVVVFVVQTHFSDRLSPGLSPQADQQEKSNQIIKKS